MNFLWLLIVEIVTRGHTFKIVVPTCKLKMMRRFSYTRVIKQWKSLSECTVMQPGLPSFKKELDKKLGDLLYTV